MEYFFGIKKLKINIARSPRMEDRFYSLGIRSATSVIDSKLHWIVPSCMTYFWIRSKARRLFQRSNFSDFGTVPGHEDRSSDANSHMISLP